MNKRLIANVIGCACLMLATAAEAEPLTMVPGISPSLHEAEAAIRPTISQ